MMAFQPMGPEKVLLDRPIEWSSGPSCGLNNPSIAAFSSYQMDSVAGEGINRVSVTNYF